MKQQDAYSMKKSEKTPQSALIIFAQLHFYLSNYRIGFLNLLVTASHVEYCRSYSEIVTKDPEAVGQDFTLPL